MQEKVTVVFLDHYAKKRIVVNGTPDTCLGYIADILRGKYSHLTTGAFQFCWREKKLAWELTCEDLWKQGYSQKETILINQESEGETQESAEKTLSYSHVDLGAVLAEPEELELESRLGPLDAGEPMVIQVSDGKRWAIRDSVSIGRDESNTISLHDPLVSKRHAFLKKQGNVVKFEDCGSRNGSYINNKRIGKDQTLADRDRIWIGKTQFVFSWRNNLAAEEEIFTPHASVTIHHEVSFEAPYKQIVQNSLRLIESAGRNLRIISDFEAGLSETEGLENTYTVFFDLLCRTFPAVAQLVFFQYDALLERFFVKKKKTEKHIKIAEAALAAAQKSSLGEDQRRKCFLLGADKNPGMALIPFHGPENVLLGFLYLEAEASSGFSEQDIYLIVALAELLSVHKEKIELMQRKFDLDMARKLQQKTLHNGAFSYSGAGHKLDGYGLCCPAGELGGDYYGKFWLEPYLYLFVGDVQGKGPRAALAVSAIMAYISGLFCYSRKTSLEEVARKLDTFLVEAFPDPSFFTTMLLLQWDSSSGTLKFINAGHEDPLRSLFHKNLWEFAELSISGWTPLGINKSIHRNDIEVGEIALEKNTLLVLYTDGITEAMDSQKKKFGLAGLKASIQEQPYPGSLETMTDHIIKKIATHRRGAKQSDDITLVMLTQER